MTSVASSVGSDRKDLLKCLQQQQEDEYCNNPTTIGDLKVERKSKRMLRFRHTRILCLELKLLKQ